jgi:PAS domain-containing protein
VLNVPSNFKEIVELTGLILGVISALIIATKNGRGWIVSKFKSLREKRATRQDMPNLVREIRDLVGQLDHRLQKVEYEISPNGGGSMKDALKLIKAEIEASNWLSPRPTFRTTSSGINTFVNEAYCQLCGVTSEELMRLGWKNFCADEEQSDEFFKRWLISAKELSQFSGKLKIQNKRGEYRGEWIVRIRLLGPIDSVNPDYLWHGGLYPLDDIAMRYARNYNIPLR